jgi:hypothetical protein
MGQGRLPLGSVIAGFQLPPDSEDISFIGESSELTGMGFMKNVSNWRQTDGDIGSLDEPVGIAMGILL